MRNLIQDTLSFSQINKEEFTFTGVDLNIIAAEAMQDLEVSIEQKKAVVNIQPLPTIYGDHRMMRQLFENIISNALKYAKSSDPPVIDIHCKQNGDFMICHSGTMALDLTNNTCHRCLPCSNVCTTS